MSGGSASGTARRSPAPRETAAVFAALAHPARREILLVLRFRGGRATAGAIAGRFSCAWPTTTRHLGVLLRAGLVRVRRRGRERVYSVDRRRLLSVAGAWLDWFDDRRNPPLAR